MMGSPDPVGALIAGLTPERVGALVHELAAGQPAGAQTDVTVPDLVARLTRGIALGSPAEAWSAQLRLQRAIAAAVAQRPDMAYIEGDS